ncbi:hypothetical protein ROZALSC1DRAFT_26579 [Rozella allomycis CSF55]|uniref:Transcription and mRNA export factor SUS1 n=1 Tax=Rozella allomycis (strain CSF55) TaxID=988480 RepID=A0A075AT84_ROZAC|nr:hypothetical protein O9G_001237 [Rozella allomycis CSF55]RKP22032.1 hypothetical protein ROZALSC1DRAFT_26579 [Rozella allomycis CSF55]|eukprot:EPZ33486.1 hypothetical protein O9G_001237 [Rozella allomycis CSF55]
MESLKQNMEQKLSSSGTRDKLKVLLQQRLMETGWIDNLKAHCRDEIKRKNGVTNVNIEIASIPENVKGEVLLEIKQFLQRELENL